MSHYGLRQVPLAPLDPSRIRTSSFRGIEMRLMRMPSTQATKYHNEVHFRHLGRTVKPELRHIHPNSAFLTALCAVQSKGQDKPEGPEGYAKEIWLKLP